jgi:membrane protein
MVVAWFPPVVSCRAARAPVLPPTGTIGTAGGYPAAELLSTDTGIAICHGRPRTARRQPRAIQREDCRLKTSPTARGSIWRIVSGTIHASTSDNVSLAAAGCAFYATLSLFPAISMMISVYGLLFDPASVVPQLEVLRDLLPVPAFALIEDRVMQLVAQPRGPLTIGLGIAFLVSFWSSASASKAVLSAINVAYDTTERRSFLRFQLIGLAMTLGAVAGVLLAIAVLLILPPLIRFSGLSLFSSALIQVASFGLMVGLFALGLGLLYAHGPSRTPPKWSPVLPGTALATMMWLLCSYLLSLYVAKLANFDSTYGSIGAVVGIMLWFYVSAYAALLGAELNAQLELAAAVDDIVENDLAAGQHQRITMGDPAIGVAVHDDLTR